MIIIGERINSSRKKIAEAIAEKNGDFLVGEARKQAAAGAHFLDVNCAASIEDEVSDMEWLVELIQGAVNIPLCIDSPNPDAIAAGLKKHRGRALVNSITLERKRAEKILPLAKEHSAYLVALTMDEKGMPQTAEERVRIARRLNELSLSHGIATGDLYIDLLVRPISSEPAQGKIFLDAVKLLKAEGLKAMGGLSNISFGLPDRRLINAAFLSMAADAGIDAAIIDPTEKETAISPYATSALLGEDQFCMNYITAFRGGKL